MTDKVQKMREEVVRLKSQLLRGACSSQVAMETRCKEEAYNEVLAILDSMQEEPKECMYSKDNYTDKDRKVLCDGCDEKCELNKKEEPVSDDLEFAALVYAGSHAPYDDCMQEVKDAYIDGYKKFKQQMMAKAVKVNISNASIVPLPSDCNLKVGDKVLIIKED